MYGTQPSKENPTGNYYNNNNSSPVTGVAVPGFTDYSNMNNNNNNNNNFYPPPPPPPPPQQQQSAWGQPGVTCNMTSNQLEHHLRESNHGSNTAIFNCYFIPQQMPPRCAACSRLIAEHPSAPSSYASPSAPQVVVGAPTFLQQSNPGQVSEDDMPKIKSEGNKDVYVNSGLAVFRYVGLLLLTIGLILFVVFGAKFDPNDFAGGTVFIAPCVLTFMGTIFTAITKTVTLTMDKDARRISYHSSRFPWICFSSAKTVSFADVHGVSVESTNVSINHVPQSAIKLKVRNMNEDIDLGMYSMYEATTKAQGWKVYLTNIGCPIV